jgi:hypothetical protein
MYGSPGEVQRSQHWHYSCEILWAHRMKDCTVRKSCSTLFYRYYGCAVAVLCRFLRCRSQNKAIIIISYRNTSILSWVDSILVLSTSSHSALTTVVFKIFERLSVLSVSHLLSSPSVLLTATICTPVSPSGRLGPPGRPEAELVCVVFSCESMGKKRLIPCSF